MKTLCSNTIVKNGMPFIIPVLEQVLPFMNRSLVTYSRYCEDTTIKSLINLRRKYPEKLVLFQEQVECPAYLTIELGKLLGRTTEDWVLFLDSDDWWSTDSMKEMLKLLDSDVDAFAFNPYQVIDKEKYDSDWWTYWFTKLFKNGQGVHYEGYYPKENIYKYDQILWWKQNPKMKKSDIKYFHLANIMKWRFRDNEFEGTFKKYIGKSKSYPESAKPEVERIFGYL
jgi:hypothetical protein